MRTLLTVVATVAVLVTGAALLDDGPGPAPPQAPVSQTGEGAASDDPEAPATPGADVATTRPVPEAAPAPRLLLPAAHGDGDSWRDTAGEEYRLGMVNAPEQDECFGAEATAERRRLTADGFRAVVYERDRYGRGVSVVTTAGGVNLNVHLARHGFADDRYLDEFRSENPALADQLDAAFAAARAERRGLWGACAAGARPVAPPAAAPAAAGCHPAYATCIPVAGDGSGHGGANDLDCGDLTGAVSARQPGVDPYRLDGDGDGVGCDS